MSSTSHALSDDERRAPVEAEAAAAPRAVRVLVIDSEQGERQKLASSLESFGCEVEQVASAAAALNAVRREPFDLVLCDLELGQESGLDLLPRLLAERTLDVVLITAQATLDSAVEAMRRHAKDYLSKPLSSVQIRQLVDQGLKCAALEGRHADLETRPRPAEMPAWLETASPRMRAALLLVQQAAAHDAPVLFRGEVGTGKTVLARALHGQSARRDRPFVVVSCGAVSEESLSSELFGQVRGVTPGAVSDREGRAEAAGGGTLFLDELGEISAALQSRLLRLVREKRFVRVGETRTRAADVRVVAATSRDLEAEVKAGRFRQDLLDHLDVVEIVVPPLRERVEDVLPLAEAFAAFFAGQAGRRVPEISLESRKMLVSWPWPGNVRELRDAVERALVLAPGDALVPRAFPAPMAVRRGGAPALGGDYSAEEIEREHALRVLAYAPTLAEASRILGMDARTLRRKRQKWGF